MVKWFLILSIFLIAGCENPNDDGSSNTASVEWSCTFDDKPLTPVVMKSTVYITTGKSVFALNASNGYSVWRIDKNVTGNIFAADGRVYFKSGSLVALNADNGIQIWQTSTPYSIIGAGKDYIAVGTTSDNGGIAVYDGSNGKREWNVSGNDEYPITSIDCSGSDGVIVCTYKCHYSSPLESEICAAGFDIVTGSCKWMMSTTGEHWSWELLNVGNGILIHWFMVYEQYYDIEVRDIETSKIKWRIDEDALFTISPQKVFASTGTNIKAYDASTGDCNWSIKNENKVIYADNYACYIASDAYLYAYDVSNGKELWKLTDATEGDWSCNSLNNTVFAVKGKKLYAIKIK